MKRFKNILYVVSEAGNVGYRIDDKVQSLARLNEATVAAVRIEETPNIEALSGVFNRSSTELHQYAVEQQQRELEEILSGEGWKGIDVDSSVLTGKDFIVIIQKVLRDNHDLVIIEDHTAAGLGQLPMRLIRKCPCPVWVIRQEKNSEFKRILAAVDLESANVEAVQLNKKIIELGYSLAQRELGEVHYLHAYQLDYESILRSPRFDIQSEEIDKMKRDLLLKRKSAFDILLKETFVSPDPKNVHLIEGDAVEVIRNALEKWQIDVIVMGTVGRTGIAGLLIGNKAEKLLGDINCTVMAVKPDGFISPVNLG